MTPRETTTAPSASSVRSSIDVPPDLVVGLLGSADENLRELERLLTADLHVRGNAVTLSGKPADVALAERAVSELVAIVAGLPNSAEIASTELGRNATVPNIVVDFGRTAGFVDPAAFGIAETGYKAPDALANDALEQARVVLRRGWGARRPRASRTMSPVA